MLEIESMLDPAPMSTCDIPSCDSFSITAEHAQGKEAEQSLCITIGDNSKSIAKGLQIVAPSPVTQRASLCSHQTIFVV